MYDVLPRRHGVPSREGSTPLCSLHLGTCHLQTCILPRARFFLCHTPFASHMDVTSHEKKLDWNTPSVVGREAAAGHTLRGSISSVLGGIACAAEALGCRVSWLPLAEQTALLQERSCASSVLPGCAHAWFRLFGSDARGRGYLGGRLRQRRPAAPPSVCLVIRTVLGCRLCSIVCLTPSTELGKATRTYLGRKTPMAVELSARYSQDSEAPRG